MFTKYIKASLAVLSFLVAVSCGVNEYSLESPDGRTCVKVLSGERLEYSITHDGSYSSLRPRWRWSLSLKERFSGGTPER